MDNDLIKKVAKAMCVALGLDPHKEVRAGDFDMLTPEERHARGGVTHDMLWNAQMWQLYRKEAALAIAANIAIKNTIHIGQS